MNSRKLRLSREHLGRLAALRAADTSPPTEAIPRVSRHGLLALSPAQEEFWVLSRIAELPYLYNNCRAFRLEGPLVPDQLAAALDAVVARHDGLRAWFPSSGDQPGQRIAERVAVPFRVDDLGDVPAGARLAAARERIAAEARAPFDLERPPLLRSRVLRLGPDDHIWALTIHHILVDDWSLGIVVREVAGQLAARRAGRVPELAAPQLHHVDVAAWQRERVARGDHADQLASWQTRLAGAPTSIDLFGAAAPRGAPRQRGGRVPVRVPPGVAASLRELAGGERTTAFAALYAGFVGLWARCTRQDDSLIGSVVAGRTHPATHDIVGPFVNTVALRTDASGRPSFRDLIQRAAATVAHALTHQDVAFHRLATLLRRQQPGALAPVGRAMFLMGAPPAGWKVDGLAVTALDIDPETSRWDLHLWLGGDGDALTGYLGYDRAVLEPAGAEHLVRLYTRLLAEATAAPDRRIDQLPLGGPEDRRVHAVPDAIAADEHDGPAWFDRLRAHVAARPDDVAVELDGRAVTFAALDRCADHLRAHLDAATGDGPVGLWLARSPGAIAGALAAWRAGRRVVPLDPAWSGSRAAAALAARGVRRVICDPPRWARTLRAIAPRRAPGDVLCVPPLLDELAAVPGAGMAPSPCDGPAIDLAPRHGAAASSAVSHAAITRLTTWLIRAHGVGPADRLLWSEPVVAELSLALVCAALAAGARVAVAPGDLRAPGEPATLWAGAARSLDRLIAAGIPGTDTRLVIVTGALPRGFAERLHRAAPSATALWLDGPPWTLHRTLAPDDEGAAQRCAALPGVRLDIVDASGAPCPAAVAGRLHVIDPLHGHQLGLDATSGWTGAWARRRTDGTIDLLGSDVPDAAVAVDAAPGISDLEDWLTDHPDVRDAAIVAPPFLASELRRHLEQALPPFMIPSLFVALDALPLSPSGKLDRRALPAPDARTGREPAAPDPPPAATGEPPRPVDDAERRRLLVDHHRPAPEPGAAFVLARFASAAARAPDATALEYAGERMSYGELARRGDRLAATLRGLGVGPEVAVGLFMERSLELVVAIHGILKAGGYYVPLDPSYPAERLAYMLGDSNAAVVVTLARHLDALSPGRATVVVIDQLADGAAPPVTSSVTGDDLAYAIYTSGSTGRPKSAGLSHDAVTRVLAWFIEAFELDERCRMLLKTPISFDVSVCELFGPLSVGGVLVIASPEGHRDPAYLARVIDDARISHLQFVPSLLRAFQADLRAGDHPTLRWVIAGGEPLPADVVARHHALLRCPLVNVYGPTETAVWMTSGIMQPGVPVSIGRPAPGCGCYVLDDALALVPVGHPGELYIGGAQVARGYLRRPGLTAERFLPDPFGGTPGGRMYRTGDRVQWNADGTLAFLGRADDQVKIRGHRVELGEIEARLVAAPGVAAAAVVARPHADDVALIGYVVPRAAAAAAPFDDRPLVAFVVASDRTRPSPARLAEHLALRTDRASPLAAVVELDALPRTPSGGLDRAALVQRALNTFADAGGAADGPASDAEREVAAVWTEVLGIDDVGLDRNFFDLGGHSLMAVRVLARLRARLGAELQLGDFYAAATVRSLAALVTARAAAG